MPLPRRALLLLLPLAACAGTPKGTPEELLSTARSAYEKGDYDEAKRYASAITKKHEDAEEAEEALFLLAESQRQARQGQRSFESYKKFTDKYPNSRFAVGVAAGEYALGNAFLEGDMPGFLFFGADKGYGARILDHMQVHFRNHSLADDALKRVADYRLAEKDYVEAAETLRRLLAQYPRGEYMLWARFQLARSLWLLNQGPLYDERLLLQSRRGFEDYVGTARLMGETERQAQEIAAAQDYVVRINERLAEKEYLIARFYERTRAPRAALYYYRHCVRTYPDTVYGKRCQERVGEIEAENAEAQPPAGKPASG